MLSRPQPIFFSNTLGSGARGLPEPSQRFSYVDCMRAMAALMVIVLHASEMARHSLKYAAVDDWLLMPAFVIDFGRAGVVLFFAISGFVIPSSLLKDEGPATFPIRRFFRLYPAYWVSIFVSLCAGWWLLGREPTIMQVVANVTMLQSFFGYQDIEGLYWTLAVELVFYAICYVLFLVGLIGNGIVLGSISLVCTIVWYLLFTTLAGPFYSLHFLVPHFASDAGIEWLAYFSVMFFGATCRLLLRQTATKGTAILGCMVGIFWLAVFPLTGIYRYYHGDAQQFVLMKYGAYALALYVFVIFGFWMRLRSRILAYLGTISFSLYLFHPSVAHLLLDAHKLWVPNLVVTSVMFVAVTVGATILVSAGVYRYVEAPAIELGKKICRRRDVRRYVA
jgi:peptidoglycan/LPS O-acetylase OafA/YrhL